MTDHAELIARAEASLKCVTDGPWTRDASFMYDDYACRVAFPYEHGIAGETIAECFQNWKECENGPHQRISWKSAEANARFIAASRQNVPDLITALKASEARVEELEAEVKLLRDGPAAQLSNDKTQELGPILDIIPDAVAAAEKAMNKYPQPNYVISKWAEETGEVTKDLIHLAEGRQTPQHLRGEIVQSLAMLHRLLVEGDDVHGLQPVAPMFAALKGGDA